MFWTSGDISSGFQSQTRHTYSHLAEAYVAKHFWLCVLRKTVVYYDHTDKSPFVGSSRVSDRLSWRSWSHPTRRTTVTSRDGRTRGNSTNTSEQLVSVTDRGFLKAWGGARNVVTWLIFNHNRMKRTKIWPVCPNTFTLSKDTNRSDFFLWSLLHIIKI